VSTIIKVKVIKQINLQLILVTEFHLGVSPAGDVSPANKRVLNVQKLTKKVTFKNPGT
jgi:hypothetical protein